jgi:hypothetical protein
MDVRIPGPAWLGAYAAAFVLLLASGTSFAAASLGQLESLRLLWASFWLSLASIAAAFVSLLLTRRR